MKRMIRYAVAFVAMVWMAVILPVSQVHAYASGTGTMHITPSQDGGGLPTMPIASQTMPHFLKTINSIGRRFPVPSWMVMPLTPRMTLPPQLPLQTAAPRGARER